MAADDYAIVVGITKYPGLGVSPDDPADLKGSERDALEVANWLKAKDGGDLPDDPHHVNLICTSDFQGEPTATKGEPQQQRLRDAFDALVQAGKEKPRASRDDPMLGRRLYIYMSGHRFSPSRLSWSPLCRECDSRQRLAFLCLGLAGVVPRQLLLQRVRSLDGLLHGP
jgi:hypothetical protein